MTHRTPFDPHVLSAYIDDDLDAAGRLDVEQAAEHDPDLRQELLELQAVSVLLGSLPERAPGRSFRLGGEFARLNQPSAGRVVQLLPALRSLSVAAAIIFIVVAGSLALDINGNSTRDAGETFTQQNVLMGVTESETHSSEESGDESSASGDADSPLAERGDTASANEDSVESLPAAAPDAQDLDEETGAIAASGGEVESGVDDRTAWYVSAGILGILAIALSGTWYAVNGRMR